LTDFQFELPGSNFKKLALTRELCERPRDMLLKMLEKSPFVDYIERFKKEYGIELILDEDVQNYIEDIAKRENLEVSATIMTARRFQRSTSAPANGPPTTHGSTAIAPRVHASRHQVTGAMLLLSRSFALPYSQKYVGTDRTCSSCFSRTFCSLLPPPGPSAGRWSVRSSARRSASCPYS
jgi:hypothetical protein